MAVTKTVWVDGSPKAETTHAGLVVATDSSYLGDGDSTYWGVVWNGESGTFEHIHTGYTQGAEVDAPEHLVRLYTNLKSAERALAQAKAAMRAQSAAEYQEAWEAAQPTKGKTVQVVKGRKVAKGTTGEVIATHDGQWGLRVLLKTADGSEVWTSASNVEVVASSTEEVAA